MIVATYPSGRAVTLRSGFAMAGQPSIFFAYDMPLGRHDGSMAIAHHPDFDFVVWCQWENDPPSAREACDQVSETLKVK